jgi:hypothetical protein
MPAAPLPEELVLAGRAWRLAILATADADLARRTLALLPPPVRGQPLDADRIDRLAIQSLRRAAGPESRAAAMAEPGVQRPPRVCREPLSLGPAHDVIASLPLQAAEAWVLRRLDDLDPIRACRAMDCSRSAADRFLERADRELADRLGEEHAARVAALRAAADELAPDPRVVASCMQRARARSRRRVGLAVAIIGATLTILLMIALAAT